MPKSIKDLYQLLPPIAGIDTVVSIARTKRKSYCPPIAGIDTLRSQWKSISPPIAPHRGD